MGFRSTTTSASFSLLWKVSTAIAGIVLTMKHSDAFLTNPSNRASSVTTPLGSPTTSTTTKLFSSATTATFGTAPVLKSLLKKPSKVLTIGVEYSPLGEGPSDGGGLDVLSMQLRQQAKVSFIVCGDIPTIHLLSHEQETARGNFPGPVPIVYHHPDDEESVVSWQDLSEAGASSIVIDAGETEAASLAESASSFGLETIWKVSAAEQVRKVLERTDESADVFLIDVNVDDEGGTVAISETLAAVPKTSMSIATLYDPMQDGGAEIETGKEFKSMGFASVLVKNACVGDKEDVDYASFVVSGMTSKASKEFKFSGLTGSTNGHFGGIQSNSSVKWERTKLSGGTEDASNDSETE